MIYSTKGIIGLSSLITKLHGGIHRDLRAFFGLNISMRHTIIARISFPSRGQTKAHQSLCHYRDQ